MSNEIITTLHPESDENTNLYPNIKNENIPNDSITEDKLTIVLRNKLANAIASITQPKYYNISDLPTSDVGLIVGSDGYIYSWNGSSYVSTGIVYQATQLANDSVLFNNLDIDLKTRVFKTFSINHNNYTDGGFILYSTGDVVSQSTYSYTDFIECDYGDVFNVYGRPQSLCAFYDKDKNYIDGINYTGGFDFIDIVIDNPNIKYARFSQYNLSLNNITQTIKIVKDYYITTILYNDVNLITSFFINNTNGVVTNASGYKATPYIRCDDVKYIKILNTRSPSIGAFYDKDYNYISGIKKNGSANDLVDIMFKVPSNAYYLRLTIEQSSFIPDTSAYYIKLYREKNIKSLYSDKTLYGKKYVAIGDSITWYDGHAFNSNTSLYTQLCVGYQSYVREKLGVELVNMGFSGEDSNYMVTQVNNTDFSTYDIVSIMTGMNDGGHGVTIAQYKTNLRTMIEKILTDNPDIKLFMLSSTFGKYDNPTGAYSDGWVTEDYPNAMKEIALEYNLPFYDNYHNNGINKLTYLNYMADLVNYHIHPNLKGYKLIGNQIANFMFNELVIKE